MYTCMCLYVYVGQTLTSGTFLWAIMDIPVQIKTDNGTAYVSKRMKQFFAYYNIKHITGIPHNPTGQEVI